jgi:hypothetical protein
MEFSDWEERKNLYELLKLKQNQQTIGKKPGHTNNTEFLKLTRDWLI